MADLTRSARFRAARPLTALRRLAGTPATAQRSHRQRPHHRIALATPRKALLACVLACSAVVIVSAPSTGASTGQARLAGRVPFGMGDQNPAVFYDPRFIWLGIRSARVLVPWDATRHHGDLVRAEQWLNAARAAGVEPLVAFDHSTNHENLLPSLSSYAGAVRAFMRHFRWVNHYQPWNEENQGGQPTSHNPARAAQYFNWLNGACHKCAVTAADLLDGPSMVGWLQTFLKYAHGPQIWGLHPYFELHRGGSLQLDELERMVHGQIWLTEAGLPMWRFTRSDNRFQYTSMSEQVNAVKRLMALMRRSGRITRIYYYQWRAPTSLSTSLSQLRHHRHVVATWDSGLLNPDCSVRPTFKVVAQALGRNPSHIPKVRRSHNGWECLPLPPPHSSPATGGSAG
jgi:polysaccharide biosynthesis protein PslG